jgi:hypothetical protein
MQLSCPEVIGFDEEEPWWLVGYLLCWKRGVTASPLTLIPTVIHTPSNLQSYSKHSWKRNAEFLLTGAGKVQSIQRLAAVWTVRCSNSGVRKRISFSLALPNWPWDPPNLLYFSYWPTSSGIKQQGPGIDQPPPSRAEINNECRAMPQFALLACMAY